MSKPKKTKEEMKHLIETDPDFINSSRHNYSLASLEKRNPKGITDMFAARLLCITIGEFHALYENAIKKYRQLLKVDIDSGNE